MLNCFLLLWLFVLCGYSRSTNGVICQKNESAIYYAELFPPFVFFYWYSSSINGVIGQKNERAIYYAELLPPTIF